FCTVRMRETVGWARELLGGNGILLETHVGRFVADSEAIYSYEGTREINTLSGGRAITGLGAFVRGGAGWRALGNRGRRARRAEARRQAGRKLRTAREHAVATGYTNAKAGLVQELTDRARAGRRPAPVRVWEE